MLAGAGLPATRDPSAPVRRGWIVRFGGLADACMVLFPR